jgi:hypothetical protein
MTHSAHPGENLLFKSSAEWLAQWSGLGPRPQRAKWLWSVTNYQFGWSIGIAKVKDSLTILAKGAVIFPASQALSSQMATCVKSNIKILLSHFE